tara:strand:- start:330 stop:596 length:267 start_codon:yes stop_codon:yes gene_type:complete
MILEGLRGISGLNKRGSKLIGLNKRGSKLIGSNKRGLNKRGLIKRGLILREPEVPENNIHMTTSVVFFGKVWVRFGVIKSNIICFIGV